MSRLDFNSSCLSSGSGHFEVLFILANTQRETLFFFLDTISKLLHEPQVVLELKLNMNTTLALMKQHFPMKIQVQVNALTYIIACVICFL